MLGDRIAAALGRVGLTEERVERWVGRPCGCPERAERLNQLDAWARRVLAGRVGAAKEWLAVLVGEASQTGAER